ncbi:M16 family metallopeptidase [Streptomyces durhamensis]|uniref:M16 family metallopeptidase n=1 Tax=Streptomyces durhamensis TaxID=68194 RepID=UPI00056D6532|nr:insulinase family protein [Streptomyces durhamensis]
MTPEPYGESRLDTGLRLVTEELPGRGLVAVALTVAAGGDDDPAGGHGTAHLVEHLMFPRDEQDGADAGHVALVQEAGGMCDAETHRDHTVFHTVAPADALPGLLALEARRLLRFAPAAATVRSEAAVVTEEIRAAGAGTRLWDGMLAAVHPGARHAYGTPAELRGVTADDAEAFFRRHYRPDRAVLCVAGDVPAGRVRELVEREFAGWRAPADGSASAAPAEARAAVAPPPVDLPYGRDAVPVAPPGAVPYGGDAVPVAPPGAVPYGRDAVPVAPPVALPYGRDAVAVGHALADPRQGLGAYVAQVVLLEVLRRARSAGASVHCGYQGQWLASAAPDLALVLGHRPRGAAAEEAAAGWLRALAALAAEPPAADEVRRAVNVLRAGCHRRADAPAARAVAHGRAALLFPPAERPAPDTVAGRLAAVTPTDVSIAAQALLGAPRAVVALEAASA